LALAGADKAIISYRVGKRTGDNCRAFLLDLRSRVFGAPESVTDHIWTIGELVDAALEGVLPGPGGRRYGRFTVIDGGRE
jgi:hypothetical protein